MGDTIKLKKGLLSALPALMLGEPALTTDEERLYIGGIDRNIPVAMKDEFDAEVEARLSDKADVTLQLSDIVFNVKHPTFSLSPASGGNAVGDSLKIQAFIDYASEHGGGTVLIPNGNYKVNLVIKSGVELVGQSRDGVVLTPETSGIAIIMTPNTLTSYWELSNFTVVGGSTSKGIYLQRGIGEYGVVNSGVSHVNINKINLRSCQYGLYFEAGNRYQCQQWISVKDMRITSSLENGLYAVGSFSTCQFENIYVGLGSKHGVYFDEYLVDSAWFQPTLIDFKGLIAESNGRILATTTNYIYGVYIARAISINFESCWFESNGHVSTLSYGGAIYFESNAFNVKLSNIHTANHSRHFHIHSAKVINFDNISIAHGVADVTNIECVFKVEANSTGRCGKIIWLYGVNNINPFVINQTTCNFEIQPVNMSHKVAVASGATYVDVTLLLPEHHAYYYIGVDAPDIDSWSFPAANRLVGSFRINFPTPPTIATYLYYKIIY